MLPGITDNGNAFFKIPEVREQMSELSAFKRIGEPDEVADAIVFLATDEARWNPAARATPSIPKPPRTHSRPICPGTCCTGARKYRPRPWTTPRSRSSGTSNSTASGRLSNRNDDRLGGDRHHGPLTLPARAGRTARIPSSEPDRY
ncbi:hypothetical protein [Streptomyces coeruleorubidus]|uniref:hypothetical protein n=1 Tax=Streptomyces coeruleorubidus TaxID=116188 RepID=UPI003F4C84EB